MGKLSEIRNRQQQWGVIRACYWEIMNALRLVFGLRVHYVFVGTEINDAWLAHLPQSSGEYDTRSVELEELLPFVDSVPDLSRENLELAFCRGDKCIANFLQGELVGFSFTSWIRVYITNQLDLMVPEGFSFEYKGWTHPEHRQKKLANIRERVTCESRFSTYAVRPVWHIETHNYPSLLGDYLHPRERELRAGFIGWFSLFGKQIPFNSRRAKWYGVEIVKTEDTGKRQYLS